MKKLLLLSVFLLVAGCATTASKPPAILENWSFDNGSTLTMSARNYGLGQALGCSALFGAESCRTGDYCDLEFIFFNNSDTTARASGAVFAVGADGRVINDSYVSISSPSKTSNTDDVSFKASCASIQIRQEITLR